MRNFIYVKERFFPVDWCQYYVSLIEKGIEEGITWQGMIGGGKVNKKMKSADDLCLSADLPQEIDKVLPFFEEAVYQYREFSDILVNVNEISEITVRKYSEGEGYYRNHVDVNWGENLRRAFVILIYLNDVIEGGELYLRNHDFEIKPQQGMLVMFPSGWTWEHEARTVLKGDRYIMRSFGLICP